MIAWKSHCTVYLWLCSIGYLTCSAKESERRLDLIMENAEIVDMLQQVGHLLQREGNLSKQLHGETSFSR